MEIILELLTIILSNEIYNHSTTRFDTNRENKEKSK